MIVMPLSEMLPAEVPLTPTRKMPCPWYREIVPRIDAERAAAVLRLMPLVPPVALTAVSVTASGAAVVAELSIFTPVPSEAVIVPALIVSKPV